MKKLNFLYVIICLSVLAISCNKDDDPKVDPVVGRWDLINVKIEITNNKAAADTINGFYSPFQYVYGAARIVLDVKSDKLFQEEWIYVDGTTDQESGKWEKKGTTFTLKYDKSDDVEYSIINADATNLKLTTEQVLNLKGTNANAKLTYSYEK